MALDIILNFLSRGDDDVKDSIRDTKRAVEDLDGAGGGLGSGLDESAGSALLLNERLEGLARSGEQLSNIGGQAVALAQGFSAASREAEGISKRFESMAQAQGRTNAEMEELEGIINKVRAAGAFSDDEELKSATSNLLRYKATTQDIAQLLPLIGRVSRSTGQDLASTSRMIGQAYGKGDVTRLSRLMAFTQEELKAVKAAKKLGDEAAKLKFMEVVTAAADRSMANLGDSITDAQKRTNEFAFQWGEMEEAMGKGSSEAEANVQGMIANVLQLANASPQLMEQAGAWTYYGGQAAVAGGSILQVLGNTGMAIQGFNALKVAGVGSLASTAAAAGPVLLALAAIAAASYKAWQWTKRALTMSDEEMEKQGPVAQFHARAGRWLGTSKIASFSPAGWAVGNTPFKENNNPSAPISREQARRMRASTSRNARGGQTIRFKTDPIDVGNPMARSAARS